jgi:4-amino-4-deoxy-L-arabinose transferase-like glycosyltransferase
MKRKSLYCLLLASALGCYLGLLIEASRTRKPWNDEAMSAVAAYNLATKGHTGVDFLDEKSPANFGTRRHTYYVFPLQLFVLSVWYRAVGFSLATTRLLSTLWTLLLLYAVYRMVKKLTGGEAAARLAAALAAVDYFVMTGAAFGRYDTMVAALGFSSYALYLCLRSRRLRLALFLSNACTMAAGATHPNGLLFLIGLWFLVLQLDRKRLGWRDLGIAAIPYVAGAALWVPFVLEDFRSFKMQLLANSGGRIGLLNPWQTFLSEMRLRYWTAFGLGAHSAGHGSALVRLKALPLAAYLAGIIGCLATPALRRHEGIRVLLYLTGIHVFFLTFYENMKFSYYLVHLLPLYAVLTALFAIDLWRRKPAVRWVAVTALAAIGTVQVGGMLAKIRINDYAHSYLPAAEFVRTHVPPGDQVAASCSFAFAYGVNTQLMDDASLGYWSGRRPEYLVEEETYDGWWEESKTSMPEVYQYVKKNLADYELIYDHADYKVYRRRDLAATS